MAIVYSSPGVPGGEVSPGQGSSGFTSAQVPYANSSGQLIASTFITVRTDHPSSGTLVIASTGLPSTASMTGGFVVGTSTGANLGFGPDRIQGRAAGAPSNLQLNSGGGNVNVGSAAAASGLFSLLSSAAVTTAVGAAGNAAAAPATPEVYVKMRIPNAAHTLTTLYIPAYTST